VGLPGGQEKRWRELAYGELLLEKIPAGEKG
jgi:hypothetical protein